MVNIDGLGIRRGPHAKGDLCVSLYGGFIEIHTEQVRTKVKKQIREK